MWRVELDLKVESFLLTVAHLVFISLVDKKPFNPNEILGTCIDHTCQSPGSKDFCRMGSENRVILGDTLSRRDWRGCY